MIESQYQSVFELELPERAQDRRRWGHIYGCTTGLLVANAAKQAKQLILLMCPDASIANQLEQEIRFFLGSSKDIPVLNFPDWETLPYDVFSPYQDIISQRLETLAQLPQIHNGILIVPVGTLLQRLCPKEFVAARSFQLAVGDSLKLEEFRLQLENTGYQCVSQVMEHGEFAVRGGLLDLFPMGSAKPYRIDLFDEEIESIRSFEPENQISQENIQAINLLPAREVPLDKNSITLFRQNYRAQFEGDPQRSLIYRSVSDGNPPPGIEYYLPLFFEHTHSLFDYLPQQGLIFRADGMDEALESYWQDIENRYEQGRHDQERPLLAPKKLFLPPDEFYASIKHFPNIQLQSFETDAKAGMLDFACKAPPQLSINARATDPLSNLKRYMSQHNGRILFAADSIGRQETLYDVLAPAELHPHKVSGWQEFLDSDKPLCVTVAALEKGLELEDPQLSIICESQLFGDQVRQARRRRGKDRDTENIVKNLTELHIGDPVVHLDHGVGRYLGLLHLDVGASNTEFLALEYAGGDKLYVPVSSLHLISRYSGASVEHAPLHKLGGEQWQKAKRKATEKVADVAAELLEIYAKRAARPGYAIANPDEHYATFASAFPFEETPDQETAIQAVIEDMTTDKPMDRLVCGDVGFGKTEVAMRAAFLATYSGKQVAILVPTTLLAQQHYQNFKDRFADLPVNIEVLSRFRSKKEVDQVLPQLKQGKVDIVIGTHKLLQQDIQFKRLGLLIIDEEHRFGVRQKEKIKALRAEVDILTLTATPIPRTLNMSLTGMRDLSIISTPPARRLSIKTFVREWNKTLIREACLREIKRGGQIYFLHNKVDTIANMESDLQKLVPEAKIRIAHGQMRERDLEQVMLDFYHHRFNILLCTTIIETGIDIPNANTIIINRADRFGLAQLHQLRGRVGRSHRRAYAYLVVPPRKNMTNDAIKRLEAIESLEDLGAGFTLATHDLEIRGAGELLGEEQSGQIHEIGFTLYTELLERAVKALKAGQQPDLDRPLDHGAEIDLGLPALIPDAYLPDVHTRLTLYKRIASAADTQELRDLQVEMIDRFGLFPDQVKNLFRVTELKLFANPLGVLKIDMSAKGGRILFSDKPNIDTTQLIMLIQSEPTTFRFDGKSTLRIAGDYSDEERRAQFLQQLLTQLSLKNS